MWSNNSTRYISKDEGRISGDMCLLMLLQHYLQQQWDDRQPRCPSADKWIRNQWASKVAQSCPTLCDPMDSSLPGSSMYGIFQARVLEWLPFPSPGDLPDAGIEPRSPTLQADALPSEPPGRFSVKCVCVWILFSHKKDSAICDNMDGPWGYYAKLITIERTNTVWHHLYVKSKRAKLLEAEWNENCQGRGSEGNGEILV